jgi:hypothetical protein
MINGFVGFSFTLSKCMVQNKKETLLQDVMEIGYKGRGWVHLCVVPCGHDNGPKFSTENVTDQRLWYNSTLLINLKEYIPPILIFPKDQSR